MVTMVGILQGKFADALRELIELDFDALEAYEAALNRLEDEGYKSQITQFKNDHKRHITDLSALLSRHDEEAPSGPSGKQWLTKGKVLLGNMMGDKTILRALKSNEIDTNTAYERVYDREDIWEDARELLKRGLEDERRHKKWLEDNMV